MARFTASDGVGLAYDDQGSSDLKPIILLHGFASNRHEGWRRTGWEAAFLQRRDRVISLDTRGHGESDKPHAADFYGLERLTQDVAELMAHLDIARAHIIGFSFGARVGLQLALSHPGQVDHLVLIGVGARLFDPPRASDAMANALLMEDVEAISPPLLKSFRLFADAQGEDRVALAASTRAAPHAFSPEVLEAITAATLVVVGARDLLAGSAEGLAEAIPGARCETLPGCDHFSSITSGLAKGKVFDFLDGWLGVDMPT